jgi:hypothetical protein
VYHWKTPKARTGSLKIDTTSFQRIVVKSISTDVSSVEVSKCSEHMEEVNWFEIPVNLYFLCGNTPQLTLAFPDIAIRNSDISYKRLLRGNVVCRMTAERAYCGKHKALIRNSE